jgi:hypothetical protein
MKFSVNSALGLLTLSMVFVFAHIGGIYSQQSKLGEELEEYITEIDGRETWYSLRIDSKQVGYLFDKTYRYNSDNQQFIVYQTTTVVFETGGEKTRTTTTNDSIFFDAITGLPAKCVYEVSDSLNSNSIAKLARREKDKWIVSENGVEQKVVTNKSANLGMIEFFAINIWMRKAQEPGAKILGSEFDCESLMLTEAKIEFLREEKRILRGAKVVANTLSISLVSDEENLNFEGEVEVLKDGTILSFELGRIGMFLRPKELVIGANMVGVQTASNLTIGKHIEDYTRLASMKVEMEGVGFEKSNINSYRQTLIAEKPNSLFFELGETGQQVIAATKTEIKTFLKPGTNSLSAESEISEILHKLKINQKSADEKIWSLLAFVSVNLEDDYFSDSSEILEILKRKKGDCTEHSALFVALARAAGLPAREVSGYIYNNEADNPGFAGHAWAEVVLDGAWIGVDPMWGESRISPIHVKVGSDVDLLRVRKIRVLEAKYFEEIPKPNLEAAKLSFTNKDYTTAKNLFQKMSPMGNSTANYYLGGMYEFGLGVEKNKAKAVRYYRISAARGDMNAKRRLAGMFNKEDSALYAPTTSAFWREEAAKDGSPEDALLLAQLYEIGHGVPKNSQLAYQWYKYAAEVAVEQLGSR